MKTVSLNAYAKINLFLDVVSKRDDGYHNIESVMQSVSLADEVSVKIDAYSGVEICQTFHNSDLPCDNTNLCYKAAKAYLDYFNISDVKVDINVVKKIPCQAGLAGGSADAAAVIRALDILFEKGSDNKLLSDIGLKVGSDVGFCIFGGTCAVEGRGEIVKPLTELDGYFVVVAKSEKENVSTALAYSRIDSREEVVPPETSYENYVSAVNSKSSSVIQNGMYNIFQDVMSQELNDTYEIIDIMKKNGSLGAQMSGSGPSVFGLFDSIEKANNALSVLSEKYFAEICKTV